MSFGPSRKFPIPSLMQTRGQRAVFLWIIDISNVSQTFVASTPWSLSEVTHAHSNQKDKAKTQGTIRGHTNVPLNSSFLFLSWHPAEPQYLQGYTVRLCLKTQSVNKSVYNPGGVAHLCSPSTWETEAESLPQVSGSLGCAASACLNKQNTRTQR